MRRSSRLGGIARRDLLRAGFGSLVLGASGNFERSPFWAQASAAPTAQDGRILVVVELSGGNDGLNTVVPFDDPHYVRARPTLRIPAKEALRIGDGLGLRGQLAQAKGRFDRGQLAIVQGVGYPGPDRSHFRSTDIWHAASLEPERARTGWIGRACECESAGKRATRKSVSTWPAVMARPREVTT